MFEEKTIKNGAKKDLQDWRDLPYDVIGALPMTLKDWKKGYDIEKEIKTTIKIKNQFSSLSCVGQAFSYYGAVKNAIETGIYDEQSAKAIYSQIALRNGGAHFRSGAKHLVNFGSLLESKVKSYKENGKTDEKFIKSKKWITKELIEMAKILGAKEYRNIRRINIDIFARAIKYNHGVVAGVVGCNNGTWSLNEPVPPKNAKKALWNHALYFGKFGIDKKGKYISTPNSIGPRRKDSLHPDRWQKLRENWFVENGRWLFSPWTILDKPNLIINNNDMITIKEQGKSAVYLLAGNKIIPFAINWETYKKEFPTAQIMELPSYEIAKLKKSTLKIKSN